jgi:hypothetical protein
VTLTWPPLPESPARTCWPQTSIIASTTRWRDGPPASHLTPLPLGMDVGPRNRRNNAVHAL